MKSPLSLRFYNKLECYGIQFCMQVTVQFKDTQGKVNITVWWLKSLTFIHTATYKKKSAWHEERKKKKTGNKITRAIFYITCAFKVSLSTCSRRFCSSLTCRCCCRCPCEYRTFKKRTDKRLNKNHSLQYVTLEKTYKFILSTIAAVKIKWDDFPV